MYSIFMLVQNYLFGRFGSRILGLVLLVSMIWWAGPHVGLKDPKIRLVLIAATIAVFALVWLIRRWLVNKRSGKFRQDLDAQAERDQSRQMEIEELRTKMNEAIASLKSSELGAQHRGNAALYALPWFVIIGPPAAGKTTLLRNSGLSFPYAHDNDIDIRGFGGTRNCDWWFSNEAVLLDTAGRYTTEQEDNEEWLAFLDMLRKHRRKQPLTGAIIAISLSDLLTASPQELDRHVKIIRDRIGELTSRLGCVFPIYIVFTKCDLLYGFSSYFADLNEIDREQVWGVWLGRNQVENIARTFADKLNGVHRRLNEMRTHKLSMLRNLVTKGELFEFPEQFNGAKQHIITFIKKLTTENPYQDTPDFCGIYLTSATQEGTPLQKILGNMREAFGYVDEQSVTPKADPKTFFVKNFFQQVVFPNAHGVSPTKKAGTLHRALKTAAVCMGIAAICTTFFLLSTSFTFNSLLLGKGAKASAHLAEKAQTSENGNYQHFHTLLAVHDQYRTLLDNEKELPLTLTLGVYQGDRQLPAIRSLLIRGFGHIYFRPAILDLEQQLNLYTHQWAAVSASQQEAIRDRFYQSLQAYLMVSRPDRLDSDEVLPLVQDLIEERLLRSPAVKELTESEHQDLTTILQLYLDHMLVKSTDPDFVRPWQMKSLLVSQAQEQLRTSPDSARLYARLVEKAKRKYSPLPLSDMLKGAERGVLTSNHPQPFIFTRKGWTTCVKSEIKELAREASKGDWVTGYLQPNLLQQEEGAEDTPTEKEQQEFYDEKLAARLEGEIRALYFKDYAENWLSFLSQVNVTSFTSLDDAARKMLILTQADGPFVQLLQAVSHNINLPEPGVALRPEAALKKASDTQAGPDDAPVKVEMVAELETPLRDLRKLTDPDEKMTTSRLIQKYLQDLATSQLEIEGLARAVDLPEQSFKFSSNILDGNGTASSDLYRCWLSVNNLLHGLDNRTRNASEQLFYKPIQQTWTLIIAHTRNHLQKQWASLVLEEYRRTISGRFPFSTRGNDASFHDVANFFRPREGVIWQFVANQLKPFLHKNRNSWSENSWLGIGLNFDSALLQSLRRAANISTGLFDSGQNRADIRFAIYPVPTQGVRVVRFTSNGQSFIYQNEPQEWQQFQWPGNHQDHDAEINAVPSGDRMPVKLKYSGDWSLLHLLNEADISFQDDLYHLTWELESNQQTHTVRLNLRPDRGNNIFARGFFSSFRLPDTLFL